MAEAEATLASQGEVFIKVKEACDTIEDLKDMLAEKKVLIRDIIGRMGDIESGIKTSTEMALICHIADVFKDSGESS